MMTRTSFKWLFLGRFCNIPRPGKHGTNVFVLFSFCIMVSCSFSILSIWLINVASSSVMACVREVQSNN